VLNANVFDVVMVTRLLVHHHIMLNHKPRIKIWHKISLERNVVKQDQNAAQNAPRIFACSSVSRKL
jgi:hypothetical protein